MSEENPFDRMRKVMEDFMKDEKFRLEIKKMIENFEKESKKMLKELRPIDALTNLSLHTRIESIDNDEMREYMKKKVSWGQEIKDEMHQYKEETGRNAVLNGMITEMFQNWLYQKVKNLDEKMSKKKR